MITHLDTEWPDLNCFQNSLSIYVMQRFHYLHLRSITLNELSLSGLVRTSVNNNWIVDQIKEAVVVKKVT